MSAETDAKRFNKQDDSHSEFSSLMSDEIIAVIKEDSYKQGHENAGIALIFTQKEYEDDSINTRHGADQDEEKLERVLQKLGFKVLVHRDYTTTDIKNKLEEIARKDHSKNSALIVVMMSHGDKDENGCGIIHTFDGTMKVDLLWKDFAGDRCPSLIGKPKLFFIQACRGSLTDFGAEIIDDDRRFNRIEEESSCRSQSATVPQKIPIMADILVMFSCADGYISIRNTLYGSWFIQALCLKLEQYVNASEDKELMTILTGVNRHVAYCMEANFFNDDPGTPTHKNMPVIMSMLTKSFVFDRNFFK